ncbi:hypothetical protein [Prochlorothrix hollandica]|nr:hypothetical protein [Prochlorothrix hollandica]
MGTLQNPNARPCTNARRGVVAGVNRSSVTTLKTTKWRNTNAFHHFDLFPKAEGI